MKTMATFEMEAGILVCGPIRDYLNKLRFMGWNDLTYLESSGYTRRTFTIRAEYGHLKLIYKTIEEWATKL